MKITLKVLSSEKIDMLLETINSNSTSNLTVERNYWPFRLATVDLVAIISANLGSFLVIWIILRCIWKQPIPHVHDTEKERLLQIEKDVSQHSRREIHEGESAGDYSEHWTNTFDLIFVVFMAIFLIFNIIMTALFNPSFWLDWVGWLENITIFLIVNIALVSGGLLCRYFCAVDDNGYIITNRNSVFKVNYTKKIHHFCAYMMPLLALQIQSKTNAPDTLSLLWSYWFVKLNLLALIKPLREKFKILMIQFNAIDRPEDRPYTLLWTVAYNNLPGFVLVIFFRWLYRITHVSVNLVTIIALVNTVGDGLAEPIGIYFGKHRYKTRGCFNNTAYERSYEGSSCVFMSSIIFTSIFWYAFQTRVQFWLSIVSLPVIMAFTEALSPHTIDACFIHIIGGITLFIISHTSIQWL